MSYNILVYLCKLPRQEGCPSMAIVPNAPPICTRLDISCSHRGGAVEAGTGPDPEPEIQADSK